jgi:hypothetical protein
MSLLDQARRFERPVRDRLRELEPLVREYDQLGKVAEKPAQCLMRRVLGGSVVRARSAEREHVLDRARDSLIRTQHSGDANGPYGK